jgi:hypothetical protein
MEQATQQNNLALAELAFSAFQRRTELLISQFNAGLYEYKEQPTFDVSPPSGDVLYDMPYFVNGVETPKYSPVIIPRKAKYGAPFYSEPDAAEPPADEPDVAEPDAGQYVAGETANTTYEAIANALVSPIVLEEEQAPYTSPFSGKTYYDNNHDRNEMNKAHYERELNKVLEKLNTYDIDGSKLLPNQKNLTEEQLVDAIKNKKIIVHFDDKNKKVMLISDTNAR